MTNVQSKVNNRVLVFDTKGKINLFKKDEDNKYKVSNVLQNFKTFDGSTVNFNKAFLTNNDGNMVTINHNDMNKSLNLWDIETEKLIRTFDTSTNLTDITSCVKNGPVNEGNTVFGTSSNGYYQFDPRVDQMKVSENTYKSVKGLNGIKATANGNFAISSEDGHVRM